MKTTIQMLAWLLGLLGLLSQSEPIASASARSEPLPFHRQALVEADWLAQDRGSSPAHAREVLQRGRTLLARLQSKSEGKTTFAAQLDAVEKRLTALESLSPPPTPAAQREVWLEAHAVVRQIAFSNPLLREVDKVLFITRRDAGGVFHMVDQFYGFNAKPGGRLLALVDPLGENPTLKDLLADSKVESGRLKGRKLERGAFLSPELSFDGKTILFAWCEAVGKDLEWTASASYHIFKVNADGTGLVQLTDGPWNDFDPCFLPGGRIAFISERRGGYLRCGRHCPTYTTFGMAADGSDIICLSYHETHEWQPSVTADGMLIYTRWDYIDRDSDIAHHPWTSRPDGSDPRSIHGNYPRRRESRPWIEMDIRAIPGSWKFVATAAAHHGHQFGSLILIDPHVDDDGAQSQLTRLTPDVPFPESEKHLRSIEKSMVYGTPWPLSEDDYLCVYDAAGKSRGIYWLDRFGNKELLYRDPTISCVNPIPLKARPMPPIIPDGTLATADAKRKATDSSRPATVAVMNVYDSDFAWPADDKVISHQNGKTERVTSLQNASLKTESIASPRGPEVASKISALRVIQVLPKSTPAPNVPRIGAAEQSNARAVLGVVPVEKDGSAFFEAPPGKALYFQALDGRGLAVQSMRSATYLHEGEQLSCQGCHEPRQRAPRRSDVVPMALRRAPSKIQPDEDGSNPFNYVRLVQPVLDRKCVACHLEKKALDLRGIIEGKHGWARSYANLAAKYGFYFHVSNGSINGPHGGSRSVAGKFGAIASPLLPFLDERHYGLKLTADEWHRMTLWLDCNSEFYGSYEDTTAQARGEVVWPELE